MSFIPFSILLVVIALLTFYFHEEGHKLAGVFFKLKPNKIIWQYSIIPTGVEANWPNKWFMLTGIAGSLIGNLVIVAFLKYLNIVSDKDINFLIIAILIISTASGFKNKGGDIYYFSHFEELEKYDYNRKIKNN